MDKKFVEVEFFMDGDDKSLERYKKLHRAQKFDLISKTGA